MEMVVTVSMCVCLHVPDMFSVLVLLTEWRQAHPSYKNSPKFFLMNTYADLPPEK